VGLKRTGRRCTAVLPPSAAAPSAGAGAKARTTKNSAKISPQKKPKFEGAEVEPVGFGYTRGARSPRGRRAVTVKAEAEGLPTVAEATVTRTGVSQGAIVTPATAAEGTGTGEGDATVTPPTAAEATGTEATEAALGVPAAEKGHATPQPCGGWLRDTLLDWEVSRRARNTVNK